jgi:hypothetical protein
VLRGDGRGGFTPMSAAESGFFVPGQTRDIRRLRTRDGPAYVVARHDARALVFRQRRAAPRAGRGGAD